MNAVYKYSIKFDHIPLSHDGAPVTARRTVGGLNMLDAQCRLKKIMHYEGRRVRLIHSTVREGRPEPTPEPPKAYHEAVDLIEQTRALLHSLEATLA